MNGLNPLATPKGIKLLCELCQKPAHVQCLQCRYTYYCGLEHQEEDWLSIHEKLCPIITVLRSPQTHANTEEERQHRHQQQLLRKQHIVSVSLQEGRRFLCSGEPHFAIPAALGALKILTEIHGGTHTQLTPAYLILAEAAIGLGRINEANQYLSQAQWSVLKVSGDVDPLIKSNLHRNLGQLAVAKNNLSEAKRQFAEDVYQASLASSPHAVEAAGGYFHLAGVFLQENKSEVAISLHDKVVSIWCSHLKHHLDSLEKVLEKLSSPSGQCSLPGLEPERILSPSLKLEVSKQAEAVSTLHAIRELRELEESIRSSPRLMVPVYYTLALLHTVIRDFDKGLEYGEKAVQVCIKCSNKEAVRDMREQVKDNKHLLHVTSALKNHLQKRPMNSK